MTKDEVRQRAERMSQELARLDSLATSQQQRRFFKTARGHLERALDAGSSSALSLASYYLAALRPHVSAVQEGRRKGEERRAGSRDEAEILDSPKYEGGGRGARALFMRSRYRDRAAKIPSSLDAAYSNCLAS